MIIVSDRKGCFGYKLIYEHCSLWDAKVRKTLRRETFLYFIIASALEAHKNLFRMSIKTLFLVKLSPHGN